MEIALVAGSKIAACTNADCAVFDSLQGPMAGSVAVSSYGVARPLALSASLGTISVQLVLGSAGGAGRPAAWAAAPCICKLRRSVPVALACAYAVEASREPAANATAHAAPR